MTFFERLQADRAIDVAFWKKHPELRKQLIDDQYPDHAHFLYELLQNAEDAKASHVTFELFDDRLTFTHNGKKLFSESNIEAITDVSKSDKLDGIGKFGIGFKSVFKYTDTPHIHSGPFSFRIIDFVYPEEVPPVANLGSSTYFNFPFKPSSKCDSDTRDEIKKGLNELAETTLLFLSNLESIQWKIGESISGEVVRVPHSENHFEVQKKINAEMAASAHFLRFDEPVEGLKEKRIAIAFVLELLPNAKKFDQQMPLADQMKITPAIPGRVAVFFPAKGEKSDLRFHLHAPFVPDLSRALIKTTPANDPLFQQLAKLTAASLHKIRDLGLLTADFLAVLPNPQDGIKQPYDGIFQAIIEEMKNEPLTPTDAGAYAAANRLLQAEPSLKKLLSKADLHFLVGYDKVEEDRPLWAIDVTQKSSRIDRSLGEKYTRIDRFLTGLEIRDWDIEQFVQLLEARTMERRFQTPNAQFHEWLKNKPLEWHQQLYALLSDHLSSGRNPSLDRIKLFRIVRISDGSYRIGYQCFFPSDGVEHDEEMPRVTQSVYSSGDDEQQQANAKNFLKKIDVGVVDEAARVELILKQRYRTENVSPEQSDLSRFIALAEKEPLKAKLFAEYFIFKSTGGKWRKPSQVFLDAPFLDTGLSVYYQARGVGPQKMAISESNRDDSVSVKSLRDFAIKVGVQKALLVTKPTCLYNPSWKELNSGHKEKYNHKSHGKIDDDFDVSEFGQLTAFRTENASRLIWHTMIKVVKPEHLVAKYRSNNESDQRECPSQLVHRLINAEWVPQGDGRFVRPAEASHLLPNGFLFDPGWQWLKAIRFGEAIQQKSEEQQDQQGAAKVLKIAGDSIQDAQWFVSLSAEERQQFRCEHERRQNERDSSKPQRPEASSRDATRRRERVAVIAKDAPKVDRQFRKRKVRVNWETKKVARTTLRRLNTNYDGQLVCQVCGEEMPFKRDNGLHYFAAVECVRGLVRELPENHIALCPVCAAKFRHANGTPPAELKEAILAASGSAISVTLAREECSIYFTEKHLQDLQTALQVVGR